jgi:hypothetical protein
MTTKRPYKMTITPCEDDPSFFNVTSPFTGKTRILRPEAGCTFDNMTPEKAEDVAMLLRGLDELYGEVDEFSQPIKTD